MARRLVYLMHLFFLLAGSLLLSSESHSFSFQGSSEILGEEVMEDGTTSYSQPSSESRFGIKGYEGKCGQTALANYCSMLAGEGSFLPTNKNLTELTEDLGPGVHPVTLVGAAKKLCSKNHLHALRTAAPVDPLKVLRSAAKEKVPVIALLSWQESLFSLHWVTVVDITESKVVFNHWGRQDQLDIDEFLNRWGIETCSHGEQAVVDELLQCKQYSYVSAEKIKTKKTKE